MRKTKKTKIAREGPNPDKSAYGFLKSLDVDSIQNAVRDAESIGAMPNFSLSRIEIHPTNDCNFSCSYCFRTKLGLQSEKAVSLPLKTIEGILKDVRENLPNENPLIIFSGLYSEPLMHPEIKEVIRKTGEHRFRFGIYTNGLLMDDELEDIVLEAASKTDAKKPSYISFNIGAALEHDRFETNLLFRIRRLCGKRAQYFGREILQVNAPILGISGKEDYDFLKPVIDNLKAIGVDNIRFSYPWRENESNANSKIFDDLKEKAPSVLLRTQGESGSYDSCYVTSMSLNIDPNGDCYSCTQCAIPSNRSVFSYGNVLENRVSEIWQSEEHVNFFRNFNPSKLCCVCCPGDEEFNRTCHDYK